jgi:hypothetical protein
MFAANLYNIHLATEADEDSVSRLDCGRRLQQPVLIGQIGGEAAAAMSLADGRSVTDPQRHTDHLLACLRVRADALRAYETTPSLHTRMLVAVSPVLVRGCPERTDAHRDDGQPARGRARTVA